MARRPDPRVSLAALFILIIWVNVLCTVHAAPQQDSHEAVPEVSASVTTDDDVLNVSTYSIAYDVPLDSELQQLIERLCTERDLSPRWIYGIINTESHYQVDAVNWDGTCVGLMQVSLNYFDTWLVNSGEDIPEEEWTPVNPRTNIIAGVQALSEWRDTCLKYGFTEPRDFLEAYCNGFPYFSMTNPPYTYSTKVFDYIETMEVYSERT